MRDMVNGFAGFGASGVGVMAVATAVVRNRPPLRVREHFVSRIRDALCCGFSEGGRQSRFSAEAVATHLSIVQAAEQRLRDDGAEQREQHVPLAVPLVALHREERVRAVVRRDGEPPFDDLVDVYERARAGASAGRSASSSRPDHR